MRYFLLALTFLIVGRAAATGEINVLTDLKSPFPPGCVAVDLPSAPASPANTLFNENISVPSIGSTSKDAQVQVTIWRTGCHDEGYSVVMVRLQKTSGDPVLVPKVYAEAGETTLPMHVAQLIRHPAVGNVGASANIINETPVTYMLGVDPFSLDGATEFGPDDYNGVFTLELFWGDYSPIAAPNGERFIIEPYVPELDPTQDPYQVLHGRMSGQYTVDGIPFSGLVLQIGEAFDDTNNVTAILFTYFEGAPFWVIGSRAGLEPGFDIVTLDMLELYGGEFITSGPGSFSEEDVDIFSIGTMTIEALDCNRLLVSYDFAEGELGEGSFEAERLIRTAGYDCNPWE
ncbi:MAG: hypothetical protein GVY32_07650 [Gammaproteobacteria bacterium]|jgi:hypothetical protein|nr:hypothetical protein [Gammaproteobacteria bacterium]